MKTKLLLLVPVISLQFANAKDSTAVKTFHRLYAGVSFTAEASYRYLKINYITNGSTSEYENQYIEERNKHDHPQFGYKTGVRFGINIFRWFGVETGFDYHLHRYMHIEDSGSWFWVNSSNSTFKTNYVYRYFDIPLALNFNIGKKRVRGIIQAGVNFNCLYKRTTKSQLFVDERVVQTYEPGDTLSSASFARFNISPFLGVGIQYQLTKFMYLRIMPMAQMQALRNLDWYITEYLWSAGVNTALLFGFWRKN